MNKKIQKIITSLYPFSIQLIIFILHTTSRIYSSGPLDKTGTQGFPYLEWSIENTTYSGNPYDLIASATFSHIGSGETRTTEMFFDESNTWRFRFTGTRTGTWTFTTSSTDTDLDGLTGTVTIDPNPDENAHGFITQFGSKWGWMGTMKAFVPQCIMYDHPQAYFQDTTKIDNDIQTFFVDHGFNGFHTRVYCRWFHFAQVTYDSVLSSDPNPERGTLKALELLISRVHRAGGMVHIWAWGDEQSHTTPVKWGINGSVDQRLQRYIAARLGPLPGWTMGYGYDCDEWVTESDLETWHTYMHNHFGWFHYLGARDPNPNTSSDPITQIYEGLDYSGYEQWKPGYDDYVRVIDARPSKPTFSEDRFRIRTSSYPEKDYNEEETRRGLYHSAMAGGVANIWGYLADGATSGGGSKVYPNPQYIKTYAEFFKNRFNKDMVRDNTITDGYCLKRSTNAHYVFYKENTSSIQMNLSGMECSKEAIAVDTKLIYSEVNLNTLNAVSQTWTAPHESDWAIAVGYFGEVCSLQCKIFLEGPYNSGTGEMSVTLYENGHIPIVSPYNVNPRKVSEIPSNITDWVLVQLRSTESGEALVSKSVLLRNDGFLTEDNGSSVSIPLDIEEGNYYILINHRNHLPVMSRNPNNLLRESTLFYSFTSSSDQYYGTEAAIDLGDGIWGMFAGNAYNIVDIINAFDYSMVKSNFALQGYLNTDIDFNGFVNAFDYSITKGNFAKSSKVP